MTVIENLCFLIVRSCIIISFVDLVACQQQECPLWHHFSEAKESCECCSGFLNRVVECNAGYLSIPHTHCVTWNQATHDVEITRCLFTGQNSAKFSDHECNRYTISTNITGPELNDVTCKHYNREGAQCRKCIDGYGPSAFSDGITCTNCSVHKHLWVVNLLFQLTMVTLLYLTVIVLQIKGTASPFNIVFTYSQLVTNAIIVGSGFYVKIMCFTNHNVAVSFLTLLGIFNLDFFRYMIPPLCVNSSLKSIHIILFDYIIAVFPIALTVLIFAAIEFHDRKCSIIVFLSSPFRRFWCRNWNPKETILNTCATFLLISYSKFLFVSLSLLLDVHTYNCHGEVTSLLLYDPTISSSHPQHIPYIVLAFSVIVIFVLLPPLLLLLYPTRLFRKCLSCCGFQRWDILYLTMDVFQGWYKDGTEGTYDFRGLSSLYMIIRVLFSCSVYILVVSDSYDVSLQLCIIFGILHILLGALFLTAKPYKIKWMNLTDGILLSLLGVLLITYLHGYKVLYVVGIISGFLFLLAASFLIIFKCLNKVCVP